MCLAVCARPTAHIRFLFFSSRSPLAFHRSSHTHWPLRVRFRRSLLFSPFFVLFTLFLFKHTRFFLLSLVVFPVCIVFCVLGCIRICMRDAINRFSASFFLLSPILCLSISVNNVPLSRYSVQIMYERSEIDSDYKTRSILLSEFLQREIPPSYRLHSKFREFVIVE